MRKFRCSCGGEIYFDSESCLSCGSKVCYSPRNNDFDRVAKEIFASRESDNPGGTPELCSNGKLHGVCNWERDPSSEEGLCFACGFNRVIPNLTKPENIGRWRVMEVAKKRLIYTLIGLQIPCINRLRSRKFGFLFDFLEDKRTNRCIDRDFIATGYADGIITINLLEADPVTRVEQKEAANEAYRTVLGHMRHESGHHYWNLLKYSKNIWNEFERLFGAEEVSYEVALKRYYSEGPEPAWGDKFISPYASMHPLEDWAETWAHYLHINDSLETAESFGILSSRPSDFAEKVKVWAKLSIGLNELNRGMGVPDNYPFVINPEVTKKLMFVDKAIKMFRLVY